MSSTSDPAPLVLRAAPTPALPTRSGPGTIALMRVLVVEDEKKIASFIREACLAEGFVAEARHSEPGRTKTDGGRA